MALAALNANGAIAIENIASAATIVKNTVINGGKGWLQYSDITWYATTAAWLLVKLDNRYSLTTFNLDANNSAKFVALFSTIYTVFNGIVYDGKFGVTKQDKDNGQSQTVYEEKKLDQLPNRNLIIWTNATAAALYAAHRFGINFNVPQTVALTLAINVIAIFAHRAKYKETT